MVSAGASCVLIGARAPEAPSETSVVWAWSGAVTAHSARVQARLTRGGEVFLLVSAHPDLTPSRRYEGEHSSRGPIRAFLADGLQADTPYHYALEIDGVVDTAHRGRFRTFAETRSSFRIALSACARTGSNSPVFNAIRHEEPLFFLHLGDLHYENIRSADPGPYREALERVLRSPAQSMLYRQVPIVYVFDDHDFGPDNSNSGHPGGVAVRSVYREYVPHYPLAAAQEEHGIFHAFTVGRVRFVVTDLRSARTVQSAADDGSKTMMGRAQKRWFKQEIRRANGVFPLIVWANTVPWIAKAEAGADHWGGYATERRELAAFFAEINVRGLVIVSGDAHMLAIDDGTNSDYSGLERLRIPVLQAAPLDQISHPKGGPYSEGSLLGGEQYAIMSVRDEGGEAVHVRWTGHDSSGRELIAFKFVTP